MELRRRGWPFGILLAAFIALTPRACEAQNECVTELKERTTPVRDGSTLCRTADDGRCSFAIALCVNQVEEDCTPQDLKRKRVHVLGDCRGARRVRIEANGTSPVCSSYASVSVRTRRHGTKAGSCTLRARAGNRYAKDADELTLRCEPQPGRCPVCGNGVVESFEQCDPPSSPACPGLPGSPPIPCNADCTCPAPHAVCGNGVIESFESCDPPGSPTCWGSLPCPENCFCPELLDSLAFTTVAGTTSCGGAGLSPGAAPPFCGELDSDTACSTKINDLGRGCLYIGGGNAKAIPPGQVPSGATSFFDISGWNLVASNGTGALTCTKGSGPGKNCLNNDTLPACTSDADCAGYTAACHGVANCFFGPPLEFPNPALSALSTCVLNVIDTDASGTGDPSTGSSTVTLPLASEVYVTGNQGSPCPHCVSSQCTYGANSGGACSTTASSLTSHDCPPERGGGAFQAPLSVTLQPLTTGTTSLTSASGNFCPSQKTAGAFAVTGVQCVKTVGQPAGDLSDGMPHSAIIAAAFCIPTTTNTTIDGVADLPGPGLIDLPGMAQIR